MKTELTKAFYTGFLLTEQELRRIYDTMTQQISQVTRTITHHFELKYKNGVVAEKSSIDEVFSESNGREWEIQELTIKVVDRSQPKLFQISLTFKKWEGNVGEVYSYWILAKTEVFKSISYYILGDERDWVFITSSLLEDRIARVKQFLIFNLGYILLGLVGVVVLVGLLFFIPFFLSLPLGDKILSIFTLILLIISGIICYLVPSYSFYWGDYTKTFDRRKSLGKNVAYIVITVIVLGVIVGLITNYLTIRIGVGH